MMTLEEEQARASEMLEGKVVRFVVRHRPREVLIEFTDERGYLSTLPRMFLNFRSQPGPNWTKLRCSYPILPR